MRGKRSDSEAGGVPGWRALELVIEGGFAGLRRGATLQAGELPAAAPVVDQLLAMPAASAVPAYPDGETINVCIHCTDGPHDLCFDSADAPEPAQTLLDLLRPRLKPLPRP